MPIFQLLNLLVVQQNKGVVDPINLDLDDDIHGGAQQLYGIVTLAILLSSCNGYDSSSHISLSRLLKVEEHDVSMGDVIEFQARLSKSKHTS